MKVIAAKELEIINNKSVTYQFNRTLTQEFINQLDPEGLNVVNIVIWGHNMDFADILHHRCLILAKVQDSKEPVEVFLDIEARTYETLTTINDVMWKESVTQ
jgi:hypothetical protein